MRARNTHLWWIAIVVALFPALSFAAPSLNVSPTSIAADDAGEVQVQVGTLGGAQVILRLFADADGDGTIDPEDYLVWADVIDDNAAPWSPAMFSDTNVTANAITIGARGFGLFGFPYTSGSYVWQAEDPADSSTDTFSFTVTQPAGSQSVSGTVTDGGSPVPGAIVLLEPFCDTGDEARRFYSTLADQTGAYTLQVPADLQCNFRLLLAAKPGFLSSFAEAPHLEFTGSSAFSENLQITPGTGSATGSVVYQNGPKTGLGVPGLTVTVEGDDGSVSIAFTDENGDYAFSLADGDWAMESPEDRLDSRGAVGLEGEVAFTVVGGSAVVPDLEIVAANAFFQGTLYDDSNVAQAGHEVSASRIWPCGNECYESSSVTRPDGTFTLGVYVPAGPPIEHMLQVEDPLDGLIGEQLACQNISSGQTITGADLEHVTPTGSITGTMLDKSGQPLGNVCISAWGGGPSCTGYRAAAVTACDGSYTLPVVDGQWNVQVEIDDLGMMFRDLDDLRVNRQFSIAGNNEQGIDFIIGRSRFSPTVTFLEPSTGFAGSRVSLYGYGFSAGSMPQVFFGSTPANVVTLRPDLGVLIVDVPGSLTPGIHQITVVNTDLGKTSEPVCFEVPSGSPTTACSIGGSVDDPGFAPVQGALVLVYDQDDFVQRIDVTDGSGAYSVDLEDPGTYFLEIVPPEGQPWVWGTHDVVCGGTADHTFAVGSTLTGQIIDDTGDGISDALIEAEQLTGGDAFANAVTDEDGFFTLYVPNGDFEVFLEPPAGSRFLSAPTLAPTVSGNTDVGAIQMSTGVYFCGAVKGVDGQPLAAEVEVFRRDNGNWAGFGDTNTCTGQVDVALDPGEYRFEILPNDLDVDDPTDVKYVEVGGDTFSSFDFVVAGRESVSGVTGPRIAFLEPSIGLQVGHPVQILAANIGGSTVDVLFDNGAGGFVAGADIVRDVGRGVIAARVPAGADSGALKIRIDGVDSPTVPYSMVPGSFPTGLHAVTGTITGPGGPVSGVYVGLFSLDSSGDCDDDDGLLVDYEVTGAGGTYGPLDHPGGDSYVVALPPTAGTLAAGLDAQIGVATNTVVDFTLVNGVAVDLRTVDDDTVPNPIANVEVSVDSETLYDWRMTDAGGNATIHLAPNDYALELIPPPDGRLLEGEFDTTIAGAVDLGDQVLARGVLVGSAVQRESDGSPVGEAFVEAMRGGPPFDFFFESAVSADGLFRGAVEPASTYNLQVEVEADDVANFEAQGMTAPTRDCILYPPLELGAAGFVDGLVRDGTTLTPLAEIHMNANEDDAGSPGDFSGFTQTCTDGTYRLKLAAGDHFLSFNDWNGGVYMTEWHPDAYCPDDAVPVTITEGATETVDVDLEVPGTISGTITVGGVPTFGANVCSTSATLGTCQFCTNSDITGSYTLSVPPATDHRIEVFVSGEGTECYDDFGNCTSFTPVAVTAGGSTTGIDLDFGCSNTDVDGDGVSECGGDCDDDDPNNFPGNPEVCDGLDNDCNAGADFPGETTDGDGDGTLTCNDCNDGDNTTFPGAIEVCDGVDNDCDTIVPGDEIDGDGDGLSVCQGDCDDANNASFPGATEICDGADNDCDTVVPADEIDADGDGSRVCDGDCDDQDNTTFPGAAEQCDGVDNDCDTVVPANEVDGDGDGFSVCQGDCNDTDNTIFPGATEICDGLDNDCSAGADFPGETTDADGDGSLSCNDCDDSDNMTFPGATEVCDGLDNDCDTVVPADEIDGDFDGVTVCQGDCDDLDGATFPGAAELCDGLDNDCDTVVPANETDADGDGSRVCDGDCDDGNNTIFPGATEVCDGLDNDCSAGADFPGETTDADGDGSLTCNDCDDSDITRFPGATEVCDGIDNDCDAVVPADEIDGDFDGVTVCQGDCDDLDGATFPGAAELCDGVDNDCDTVVPANETDADGDGSRVCDGDCDDGNNTIFPGAIEICDGLDNDCSAGADFPGETTDADGDGSLTCNDCDDTNNTIYPGATELCDGLDNDCDTVVPGNESDGDGDGVSACQGDCDDGDNTTFPGATELCDGIDNDCDTVVPGNEIDGDGDGIAVCQGDCNDADAAIFPGATEICDGIDNDCSAGADFPGETTDADGDGSLSCNDCDDTNNTIYPGATELCDGLDNDCDTVVPGNESDGDGDGLSACQGDCDDGDNTTFPGATELCDGIDNDCDTVVPGNEIDGDGDGIAVCQGDCNDADAAIFPGATEICDGLDNDCSAGADFPGETTDADGDGSLSCNDCDDTNNTIYPGATELCDGLDNDCDTVVPGNESDGDGDGVSACQGDCDDGDNTTFPGATELCDGIDNDCDTVVPANEADADGDGSKVCDGDCDDSDNTSFPGATEVCDGADNDCDTSVDEGLSTDADADGHYAIGSCMVPADDCDDADASNFPTNTEVCDGVDNNCDGSADEGFDTDGDGVTTCGGDCDDSDADRYPGNPETCDGLDNDCDGNVPQSELDVDGDGVRTCGGDCDDGDALAYPGGTEVCDGVDNNCDGNADEGFDVDGDSVTDCTDNCMTMPNANQNDFDVDGVGDVCETGTELADIDLSTRVDGFDLAKLARAFGSSCGDGAYSAEADLDRDCIVDGSDLAILAAEFGASTTP